MHKGITIDTLRILDELNLGTTEIVEKCLKFLFN